MTEDTQGGELSEEVIERLAEAAHAEFCASMARRGFTYGAASDKSRLTHNALRPFAQLSDDQREQSWMLARAIPDKLRAAGFAIVPAGSSDDAAAFPGLLLEQLAEDEHARWVRVKIANGWRFAPITDRSRMEHASMVRWSATASPSLRGTYSAAERAAMGPGELSDEEREKDRVMVRGIPRMLAQAGLAVRMIGEAPNVPRRLDDEALEARQA